MSDYKFSIKNLAKVPFTSIIEHRFDDVEYTFGVCTYKRADQLDEALKSIYSQITNLRFNVIVTDNNPERYDETEMLITQKYSGKPNLHYLKNSQNTEVAGNWNRMFQQCKTKYLIMLHDDDVLFENYLDQMSILAKKFPEYSIINCAKVVWNGVDVISRRPTVKSIIEHNIYTNTVTFVFNTPSGALFDVKKMIQSGGYDNEYEHCLDYAYMMKYFASGGRAAKTTEALMLYRSVNNASSKYEVLHNLLINDYKLKHDVAVSARMNKLLFKLFEYFDIKIRLRTILKKNGIYETFHGYTPASNLCVLLYKIFLLFHNDIYTKKIRRIKA